MTTDDSRSFFRRLFTRRLDEAAAGAAQAAPNPPLTAAPEADAASTGIGTASTGIGTASTGIGTASTAAASPDDASTMAEAGSLIDPTAANPPGTLSDSTAETNQPGPARTPSSGTATETDRIERNRTETDPTETDPTETDPTGYPTTAGAGLNDGSAARPVSADDVAGLPSDVATAGAEDRVADGGLLGGGAALIPTPRTGADDAEATREPVVAGATAVDVGASVTVSPECPLPSASGAPGSGSTASSPSSSVIDTPAVPDKSEMSVGEAEDAGLPEPSTADGAYEDENAAGWGHPVGHVPSFLDSDFDEPDTYALSRDVTSAGSHDVTSAGSHDVTSAGQPASTTASVAPPTPDRPAADTPAPATDTSGLAADAAGSAPDAAGSAPDAAGSAPDAARSAPNTAASAADTAASAHDTARSAADRAATEAGGEPAVEGSPAAPARAAAPRRGDAGEWRGIVLVTGTDTDVGKTIVTAAVAAAAQASGLRVAVVKPGQTGIITGAPTDIEVITRLAAPETVRTLAEYPEPMAPLAAATIAEMAPLELYEVVDAIRAEADKHDLVLVEGAGGLLVPMGVRPSGEAWTLADLATTLGVGALVVARAGLGTLNHTALTLEALTRRGVPAGVIIGAWPSDPQLVHWANLSEMVPHLVGALPEGAGRMDPGVFRRSAPGWLTPALFGVLDNWRVWAEETG